MIRLDNRKEVYFNAKDWKEYFQKNESSRLRLDFSEEPPLTKKEKQRILPSIASFQIGEHSDGKNLKKATEAFTGQFGELEYPETMHLFIREENNHSSYLAEFMNYHCLPLRTKMLLDSIFRRFRKTGGILTETITLVTAEIIALSYYTALHDATESKVLKQICKKMIQDELPHVVFQSFTISHFQPKNTILMHRILLMELSSFAVWGAYGKLFRFSGWTFKRFIRENMGYLHQSEDIAKYIRHKNMPHFRSNYNIAD